VISLVLAGGFSPSNKELMPLYNYDEIKTHARDWLYEQTTKKDYRERWVSFRDFILEIAVIALILWEVRLSYKSETQQNADFQQQQAVLKQMQKNAEDTSATLTNLYGATTDLNILMRDELEQTKRNAHAAERSANAADASSKTAVNALHISERPYITGIAKLNSPIKPGDGRLLDLESIHEIDDVERHC
jgi:hypothetical protein